jgi:hypothetical protein
VVGVRVRFLPVANPHIGLIRSALVRDTGAEGDSSGPRPDRARVRSDRIVW